MLRGLTTISGATLFRVVSEGAPPAVVQSPECWLMAAGFEQPEWQGSDREVTDWEMEAVLLWEWAPDQWNAEHQLQQLIEPVRQGCRQHIKLGRQNIERAMVRSGTFGFLVVNGITFRTVTLVIAVREKVTVSYAA